jgi:hypothetical protein
LGATSGSNPRILMKSIPKISRKDLWKKLYPFDLYWLLSKLFVILDRLFIGCWKEKTNIFD